jgi:hypothetical protein
MAELKQRLRNTARARIHKYGCSWDDASGGVTGLTSFGTQVLADLSRAIDTALEKSREALRPQRLDVESPVQPALALPGRTVAEPELPRQIAERNPGVESVANPKPMPATAVQEVNADHPVAEPTPVAVVEVAPVPLPPPTPPPRSRWLLILVGLLLLVGTAAGLYFLWLR